jgi:acetyltransferase
VEDSMTARGIGRMLMGQIIDYAAARGIGVLFGDVLTDNARMLDLCRHLGFRLLTPGRQGVLRVSIDPSDGRRRPPAAVGAAPPA